MHQLNSNNTEIFIQFALSGAQLCWGFAKTRNGKLNELEKSEIMWYRGYILFIFT